jgi:ribonuclease P protein component
LEGSLYATNIPSAQQEADQQTRFPRPYGRSLGPGSAFPPPEEGAAAPDHLPPVEARAGLTVGEAFPRSRRLARAADIRRCLAKGRRRRSAFLEFIWIDNAVGHPRMGLIVPRFQATAVARNRLRRRLKDAWRKRVHSSQPAWDLLIRAKREAYGATYPVLQDELLAWRDAACPTS